MCDDPDFPTPWNGKPARNASEQMALDFANAIITSAINEIVANGLIEMGKLFNDLDKLETGGVSHPWKPIVKYHKQELVAEAPKKESDDDR